jgi:hypothetical protein
MRASQLDVMTAYWFREILCCYNDIIWATSYDINLACQHDPAARRTAPQSGSSDQAVAQ